MTYPGSYPWFATTAAISGPFASVIPPSPRQTVVEEDEDDLPRCSCGASLIYGDGGFGRLQCAARCGTPVHIQM
jgi:hypothetical protein